jgi:hypothetical protein
MTGQFWTYVRYAVFFAAIFYSATQDRWKREQIEQLERANAVASQMHYPKL